MATDSDTTGVRTCTNIERRDGCPECGGDLSRSTGTPIIAMCLECRWTGGLYELISSDDERGLWPSERR